jgi:hypothetical protein
MARSLAGALQRITWQRIRSEAATRASRARRYLEQRRRFDAGTPRTPVFVVGCQRSGTNMVMWTLERSPEVWAYHEHRLSAAFRDYRLRPTPVIERLIRKSPAPLVAFKPICDSHLTDRLLERHAGSRAIWIYRHFGDVANSAARNFGDHVRDILRWIVQGDSDWLGWRGERLAPDAVDLVREVYRDDLSLEEAGAVFWYLRNRFFFDLGLERDPRVLLVRYEDLVSGSQAPFQRIFDFAGGQLDPAWLADLFASSIGKHRFPDVQPRVEAACRELAARLDAAHAAQHAPPLARAGSR